MLEGGEQAALVGVLADIARSLGEIRDALLARPVLGGSLRTMAEPVSTPALGGDTLHAEPAVRHEPRVVVGPADLERVLTLWRAELRHSSSSLYLDQVERFIRAVCEHAGADSIRGVRREHVVSILDAWAVKGLKSKPMSAKSRLNALCAIRGFFDWAIQIEEATENPAREVRAPMVRRRQERALTADEIRSMIEYARRTGAHTRALLYRTLAVSGLRIGELTALKPGHFMVDAAEPHIYVPPEASEKGKHREKTVAIDDETAAALREYLAGRDPKERAFPRPKHETLKRDMAGAGVPEVDARGRTVAWHGFRRFTPSELAKHDVSPAIAQRQLGHARVETTLGFYTDVGLTEQHEAVKIIAERLKKVKKTLGPA